MKGSKQEEKRPNEISEVVGFWLDEIHAAKKREKDFRKEGQRILDIYSGSKHKTTPFNILYSNTETLLPALFSQVPRPVVQRRYKDEDPLGKAAALAAQRALEFMLDTNVEGYETFEEGMQSATLDALLPGRGITSVKYDAEIGEIGEVGEVTESLDVADQDEKIEKTKTPVKTSELVCVDAKSWNRVYFGYAKKWSKVPWMAYEEYIDVEEARRLFGDVSDKISFTEEEKDDGSKDQDDKGKRKTALIYQIWDREGGKDGNNKIRYISPHYKEGYLKVEDDPLGLTGFFNCPRPIQFLKKSNDLNPVALYLQYENQAEELNNLTLRINKLIRAIKARGVYDTELGDDIANIMKADDNELVPADKSASLAAEKGLQNAIWFMPIEQLMNVLKELYVAREQCKQVIYEITGIADILRGASKASETLGAQEIKERWGGLRLKRLQREVQRYARDMLRMMLEIAATKFSEETWAKMTGLPFLLDAKFNELNAIAQAIQGQMQQPQQPQMPGQPPDPRMMQLQQIQQQLQTPQWSKVLELLKDDMQRAYRVDIETNSTVEPEATEDQKNIAELMTAMSQYLNGIGPLVAKGIMPFEAATSMLLAISRRFRFGAEVEEYIKQMKPPKPEDDGKAAEQAKLQQEQQQHQAELQQQQQIEMAKHQREQQSEQNRMHGEMAKLQFTKDIEVSKIQAEQVKEAARIEAEKQAKIAELQSERHTEQMKAQMFQETELKKATLQAATQIEIARISATKDAAESVPAEAGNQVNDIMNQIMSQQTELMKIIGSPRIIERDQNGKAIRLVAG